MFSDLDVKRFVNSENIKRYETQLRVIGLLVLIVLIFYAPRFYHWAFPTAYVSQQDSFQVVFPGKPTVKNLATSKEGSSGTATGRLYDYVDQAKELSYGIYVTEYSVLDANSLPAAAITSNLQYEIEQIAQADNAKLSNGATITFDGMTAVSATMTPEDSSEASTRALAFLHGHYSYVLLGSGISQSKFNSFSKSFKVLGQ